MTTAEDFDYAATEAFVAGKRIPCVGRTEWTSDNPHVRAEAAIACTWCPVYQVCGSLAATSGEDWHVWGGHDRGKRGVSANQLPAETVRNIHALNEQGTSLLRIAKALDLKRHQVRWHVEKLNPGPPPRRAEHYTAVVALAKTGMTYSHIARELGISKRRAQYSATQARKAGEL